MTAGEQYERFGHLAGGVPIRPHGASRPDGMLTGPGLRQFPGEERSVSEAREWARALLEGRMAAPLLDDVVLLLSELVTNAVTHSDSGSTKAGPVTVQVSCEAEGVRVEVRDSGSTTSSRTMRVPDADDDGGRGLWLVDLLATAWGADQDTTGGSVWFRVAEHVRTEVIQTWRS
ncbi:hypothetical protein GCM10023096_17740 [Nonomuraea ferruginea]